jgi:dihydrodipicolinate reductase
VLLQEGLISEDQADKSGAGGNFPMSQINVLVHGALGKMGQEVLRALCQDPELEAVAGVDRIVKSPCQTALAQFHYQLTWNQLSVAASPMLW